MAICPNALIAIYAATGLILFFAVLIWIRHIFGKVVGFRWITLLIIILTLGGIIIYYNLCEPVPANVWILLFIGAFLLWLDSFLHKRKLKHVGTS